MKVYEKINELKGTNATAEQMLNWAEVNRIPLCCFEDELSVIPLQFRIDSFLERHNIDPREQYPYAKYTPEVIEMEREQSENIGY